MPWVFQSFIYLVPIYVHSMFLSAIYTYIGSKVLTLEEGKKPAGRFK